MIPYSLHVALLLTVCFLFYKLLLQKETYFKLNRIILLLCLLLAFILPLVKVPQQFSLQVNSPQISHTVSSAPVASDGKTVNPQTPLKQAIAPISVGKVPPLQTIIKWLIWAYWCGVIIFAINFLLQMITLLLMVYNKPVIQDGSYHIVELADDKAPCSFARYIFINPAKYDWETYNQILMHEKVHIQQRHSLDLVIAELMLVMQWFNPFAWFYRKELENNLEFLTDASMLTHYKVEPADYQLSLLKVSVPNFAMHITTNYNQSLLKKRILIMNAKRSNVHILWKYFMLAPLLIILVCVLNKPVAVSSSLGQQKPLIVNHKIVPVKPVVKAKPYVQLTRKGVSTPANPGHGISKPVSANNRLSLKPNGTPVEGIHRPANTDYRNFTADDLISLHSHGITIEYMQGLANAGYNNFTADDLISLHSRGITIEYIQGLADAGYKNFTLDDITSLNSRGITAEYVQSLTNAGYKNFTAKDIISLHSHGVAVK